MNKAQLISKVSKRSGLDKNATSIMLDLILDTITQTCADGECVSIVNFGIFETKMTAPVVRRNPRTGVDISVPPIQKVHFRVSKTFKDRVRGVFSSVKE
jgi:nucleoid DNA-binding protein